MTSVYYCGFRALATTTTTNDHGNNHQGNSIDEKNGRRKFSEQSLRRTQAILRPVGMPDTLLMVEDAIQQPDRFACLSRHCFALGRNGEIVKFTPEGRVITSACHEDASIEFPKPDVDGDYSMETISIYAEAATDRLLLLINNRRLKRQEMHAFHESTGTKRVLTLDEDQKVKRFACGRSFGVLVTENEEIFKVTKCTGNDWVLHRQPTSGIIIDAVSCGKEHVVALSRDHQVYTMGNSSRGQLGLGSTESRDALTRVDALEPLCFTMVVAGGWHSLVLSENGDLYSWGWNESGQVGVTSVSSDDNDLIEREEHDESGVKEEHDQKTKDDIPKLVFLPSLVDTSLDLSFCKIHAGSRHSAALSSDGTLYTWGWNGYGQLNHGDQTDRIKPCVVKYFQQQKVLDVHCGSWSTVVVKKNIFHE